MKEKQVYTARVVYDNEDVVTGIEIAIEAFKGYSLHPMKRKVVNTIPLLDASDIYKVIREFLPAAYGHALHDHTGYTSPLVEVVLPIQGLTDVLACCEKAQQDLDEYFARVGSGMLQAAGYSERYDKHLNHYAAALPEYMGQ